jgi:hypothetical protein
MVEMIVTVLAVLVGFGVFAVLLVGFFSRRAQK